MKDVPSGLKTAGLSLAQANDWARYYDEAKKQGGVDNPSAIAWNRFKFKYKKSDGKWVLKKSYKENNLGGGDFTQTQILEFNALNDPTQPLKFSFLAQTEGIHRGMSGKNLNYTKENLEASIPSLIGTTIKDDVMHEYGPKDDERPFNTDFAQVVDAELVKVNQQMIDDFDLDPQLLGKHGIKAVAESYVPEYSERVKRGIINKFSTELQYNPSYENNTIVPQNITYKNIAAIRSQPADLGGFLLEVYNKKYGGNTMTDEEKKEEPEGTGEEKPTEPPATPSETQPEKKEETLDEKAPEKEDKPEEKKPEEKEGEDKAEKPPEADADKKDESESDDKMKTLESEKEKIEKELESANEKLEEYRDKERSDTLDSITDIDGVKQEILDKKLSDEEFNKEVTLLKAVKEEANKLTAEAMKARKPSEAGRAPPEKDTVDEFNKHWGKSHDDVMKDVCGEKLINKEVN